MKAGVLCILKARVILHGTRITFNTCFVTETTIFIRTRRICEKEKIPFQRYVNRSDIAGGSTLGAVAAVNLPVRMLDIGVPVLAMHSARETMGIYDQYYLEKAVGCFFNWKG